MKFKVLPVSSNVKYEQAGSIYLVVDNWNDWWEFRVLYQLFYKDERDEVIYIGSVKIGEFDMVQGQDRVNIPLEFDSLGQKFFSIGQDKYYYQNLNRMGDVFRDELLQRLNDISLNLVLFEKCTSEWVTKRALLRDIGVEKVSEEFHLLAKGDSALSNYNFKYILSKRGNEADMLHELEFITEPDSNPPTNLYAIIGRNGVGKTHLLNQMVDSLMSEGKNEVGGEFKSEIELDEGNKLFENIIYISFSAFDEAKFLKNQKGSSKQIRYSYIGLKRSLGKKSGTSKTTVKGTEERIITKSTENLRNELVESLWTCREIPSKRARLEQAIEMLNTDPVFSASGVVELLSTTSKYEETLLNFVEKERRKLKSKDKELLKNSFKKRALPLCKKFSSGHSIVLLTISKLIEELEESSLVLLDEPESHLHPPLLSTFTRILSNLLVKRNGVGIIATHSPVILQEIPRKCAWIFNRSGSNLKFERPEVETFGENINIITKEVFSFELTNSGFHKLLEDVANKTDSYQEALEYFNNELGMQARAILRALMVTEEKDK